MIPVQITQTQEENDNPTMALPFSHPVLVPQIPKKFFQSKFSFKKTEDAAPIPEPNFIRVPDHMRGSTKVQGYKKYSTPAKSHGKAIKHGAFPKLEAGYKNKGDAMKARSLHLEQKSKLARGIKY